MINLVQDTIDEKDIQQLIEWLSQKPVPRLTMGPLTKKYEEEWSKWIGCKYSVFVNSGSSANLLMIYLLKELGLLVENKIVVPSLCWATDLAPVIQFGINPILCDCNLEDLSVDLLHLEKIFIEENPDALILVSVLGLSPNMDKIVELCEKYNVLLLEDNCESQGTMYKNKKLGNFGLMSSFSTYFGHTMSTIEGGMICTNDKKIYDLLKQLRSHGWDRDLDVDTQNKLRKEWGVDDFNALYTFYVPGFNVRATDLQAFIGINQLKKIDDMISKRNSNFKLFKSLLRDKIWFPKEIENTYTSSFCIPIITDTQEQKNKIIKDFKEHNIECRPLISGTMGNQPFYKNKWQSVYLPNSYKIDVCGMYIPNHPKLEIHEIELMCSLIIKNL